MAWRYHRSAYGAAPVWVAGIAISAGVGVVLAGPSPTGSSIVDAGLLVVAVALCVSVVATAPWTWRRRVARSPWVAASVMGIAVQVLARLGNVWRFGFSAAAAIAVVGLITLVAVQRRSGRRRMRLWAALGGVLGATVLALIGIGVSAAGARPNLTSGTEVAKQGLRSLKAGNFEAARQSFQLAAGLLGGAADDFSAPWAQPARLIPVVAQHRQAAVDLAESAESVSDAIARALGEIDFDRLRVVDGVIDTAAIVGLHDPLARLTASLADLASSVAAIDSPWLVGPVRSRLATLSDQIEDQQAEGERAMMAVQRAPAMLGASGKRVYFIAFTTPAEARGLGGFMGNWAEVTIDKGRIAVTNFGRTLDLAVDGDREHWIRITSSPHFPEVAQLIADGYPAASGHPIDGVFAMDVYTVASLMKLTGPTELTSIDRTVSANNAAKFLLSEQYSAAQDRAERIDLLDEVARTTIRKLLSSSLPAPPDLIKLLSPYATQGRLLGWSSHADEEDLFERMQMSGELPALDGADGLAVVIDNVGNNKIDYYLTSEVSYSVDTDPASGRVDATLDIALHNGAPAGVIEPSIVFENTEGSPPGSNVMELSVYSALAVTSVTIDDQATSVDDSSTSHGFQVSTLDLDIAAQSTLNVHMQLSGALDLTRGYQAIIRNQAAVNPAQLELIVDGVSTPGSPFDKGGIVRIGAGTNDG